MGPAWGPSGADRTQVGPMLAPWTLLSGKWTESCFVENYSACYSIRWCRKNLWNMTSSAYVSIWGTDSTPPLKRPMVEHDSEFIIFENIPITHVYLVICPWSVPVNPGSLLNERFVLTHAKIWYLSWCQVVAKCSSIYNTRCDLCFINLFLFVCH